MIINIQIYVAGANRRACFANRILDKHSPNKLRSCSIAPTCNKYLRYHYPHTGLA